MLYELPAGVDVSQLSVLSTATGSLEDSDDNCSSSAGDDSSSSSATTSSNSGGEQILKAVHKASLSG